jgi:hypothetical protein
MRRIIRAVHFAPVGICLPVCGHDATDVSISNHHALVTCNACLNWIEAGKQQSGVPTLQPEENSDEMADDQRSCQGPA